MSFAPLAVDSRTASAQNTSTLVEFVWNHDADDVRITGDFVGWGSGVPMQRKENLKPSSSVSQHPGSSTSSSSSNPEYRITLRLAPGSYTYKFIVNGEWMYDPRAPFREDTYGNINNYIDIPMPLSLHGEGDKTTNTTNTSSSLSSSSVPSTPSASTAGNITTDDDNFDSTTPMGSPVPTLVNSLSNTNGSLPSSSTVVSTSTASLNTTNPNTLSRTPVLTGSQGYIGAGVAKEFHEEYGITVDTSTTNKNSRGLGRSVSMGNIEALDTNIWSKSKGITGHISRLRGTQLRSSNTSSSTTPTAHGTNGFHSSFQTSLPSTASDNTLSANVRTSEAGFPTLPEELESNHSNSQSPVPTSIASTEIFSQPPPLSQLPPTIATEDTNDPTTGLSLEEDTVTTVTPVLSSSINPPNPGVQTVNGIRLSTPQFHAFPSFGAESFPLINTTATVPSSKGTATIFSVPSAVNNTTNNSSNKDLSTLSIPRIGSSPGVLSQGASPKPASVPLLPSTVTIVGALPLPLTTVVNLPSVPTVNATIIPKTASSGNVNGTGSLAKSTSGSGLVSSHSNSNIAPSLASSSSHHHHGHSAPTVSSLAVDAAVGIPVSIPIDRSAIIPLTPSILSPVSNTTTLTNVQALLRREGKLVLAMVGLPARGKTFMARRLKRHLSWMGYRIEIFNVGNYRRKYLGANQPHDFFDPTNEEGERKRNEMARIAFEEMVVALKGEAVDIAVFDATNTTRERRRWLLRALREADPTFKLVFIESICNDESIIRANVRETKLKSPDYKDQPESSAVSDFLRRIAHYTSIYQPLGSGEPGEEDDIPYIKLIDVGRQIIANRINGYLNSRIMFFLSNLHITPRPIWLTRHGESEYNVQGRIGGDSLLSPRGQAYALRLAAFMNKLYPPGQTELVVWTSTLRRTMMTAAPLGREIVTWKALDEIDAGICDGMTYEAIAATMPEEYASRAKNKFTYRYPRGESYQDIVHRLEPVIIELMRQKTPVLIVSHQATLRVLYAYLTDKPPESCPDVLLPLHTVVQLTQKAYGAEEVRHELM